MTATPSTTPSSMRHSPAWHTWHDEACYLRYHVNARMLCAAARRRRYTMPRNWHEIVDVLNALVDDLLLAHGIDAFNVCCQEWEQAPQLRAITRSVTRHVWREYLQQDVSGVPQPICFPREDLPQRRGRLLPLYEPSPLEDPYAVQFDQGELTQRDFDEFFAAARDQLGTMLEAADESISHLTLPTLRNQDGTVTFVLYDVPREDWQRLHDLYSRILAEDEAGDNP